VTTLLELILQCLHSIGTARCHDSAASWTLLIPLLMSHHFGTTFWGLFNLTFRAACQSLPCDSAGLLGTQFTGRFR